MQLELLSPAKNCEQGREAINHGADAVYIGAPAFGARSAAGNSIEDIEALAKYAHLYHARVFATVNTLLFDEEVNDAVKILHQLYNAGVDAAIIQDLGLLECDLPPIELHASTQTHNASVERIRFLEQVGFKRVILARETSLKQMEQIRQQTHIDLEAFIHGALCVSYSGQCYMSQYLNGRSGNRGCCGQPCRSTYDLYDDQGNRLRQGEHLLSLKDFSAARHLQEMVNAGISSFKIEGRLKDMVYVKNVTAYYRQLLDNLMSGTEHRPASSGHCEYYFTPDLEKSFNRGFTDYFLKERKPMATMNTQKSIGKKIGPVTHIERISITVRSREPLTAGDGLCFINNNGELEGFYVNHVEHDKVIPNKMPEKITTGTILWRNHDQAFEKLLNGNSASRKIGVEMILSDSTDGLTLTITDSDGCRAATTVACTKEPAINTTMATEQTHRQLSKMGDTPFQATSIHICTTHPYYLPASVLNQLRRQTVELLENKRIETHLQHRGSCPNLNERQQNTIPYFETTLDYKANILNEKSRQFYLRHGVTSLQFGLEKTLDYDHKALMTTKYCIRHELGCCLKKEVSEWTVENPNAYTRQLLLRNNKNWFSLHFDCKKCQMQVIPLHPEKTAQ